MLNFMHIKFLTKNIFLFHISNSQKYELIDLSCTPCWEKMAPHFAGTSKTTWLVHLLPFSSNPSYSPLFFLNLKIKFNNHEYTKKLLCFFILSTLSLLKNPQIAFITKLLLGILRKKTRISQ